MFRLAPLLLACTAGFGVSQATAQTIERIKLTDNELNCQQIYAEIQQMDTAMQLAGPGMPSAPPGTQVITQKPAPINTAGLSATQLAVLNHPNNANLTPEQKATLIAQTGMAESRGNAAVGALYAGAPTAAAVHGAVATDPGVQAAVARARASGMSEAQINATMGLGMQRAGLGALSAPGRSGLCTGWRPCRHAGCRHVGTGGQRQQRGRPCRHVRRAGRHGRQTSCSTRSPGCSCTSASGHDQQPGRAGQGPQGSPDRLLPHARMQDVRDTKISPAATPT